MAGLPLLCKQAITRATGPRSSPSNLPQLLLRAYTLADAGYIKCVHIHKPINKLFFLFQFAPQRPQHKASSCRIHQNVARKRVLCKTLQVCEIISSIVRYNTDNLITAVLLLSPFLLFYSLMFSFQPACELKKNSRRKIPSASESISFFPSPPLFCRHLLSPPLN